MCHSLVYSIIFFSLWAQASCMWRLKNIATHMRKECCQSIWVIQSQPGNIWWKIMFSSHEFALTAIFSCPCLLHAKCYPWFYLSAMGSVRGIKRKTGLQHDKLLVLASLPFVHWWSMLFLSPFPNTKVKNFLQVVWACWPFLLLAGLSLSCIPGTSCCCLLTQSWREQSAPANKWVEQSQGNFLISAWGG